MKLLRIAATLTPVLFMVGMVFFFAILPSNHVARANETFHERCEAAGGVPYVVRSINRFCFDPGALVDLDTDDGA